MGAYQKEWARRKRAELMAELGNRCAWCGEIEGLTFDCIVPTGHNHHRGSTDQRMCFYRKQHAAGNVQILCHSCNSSKGDSVTNTNEPEMNWEQLGQFAEAIPF